MVRRERLMNELIAKGRKAGIVVLYAPDGFGKTSVLLQYTHEVKCDPTRGPVRIIEADRATGREVFMQLEVVTEELKDKPHSLIAIDNVPNLDQHDTEGPHRQDSRPARYGGRGLYYLPSFKSSADSRAGRFG